MKKRNTILCFIVNLLLFSFVNPISCLDIPFKFYKNEEEVSVLDYCEAFEEDGENILIINKLDFDEGDEYKLEILDVDWVIELDEDNTSLMYFSGEIDGVDYEKEKVINVAGTFIMEKYEDIAVPCVFFKEDKISDTYFSLPSAVINLNEDRIDCLDLLDPNDSAYGQLINGIVYKFTYISSNTSDSVSDESLKKVERIIDDDGSIVYNLSIKKELDKQNLPFITIELLCLPEYKDKRIDYNFVNSDKTAKDELGNEYFIEAEYLTIGDRTYQYSKDRLANGLRFDVALKDSENREVFPDFSLRLKSSGDQESDFIYINVKMINEIIAPETKPEEVIRDEELPIVPQKKDYDYKSPNTACKNFAKQ